MQTEKIITTFDGTKLFLRKDISTNAKAVVVIVHGLCEHQGRYDYLTEKLVDDKVNVYRFDHRGHGKSEGKRVYFSTYEEIARDIKTIVDLAIEENKDLPIFLLGHSMGGYGVTLFATKYPGVVNGVITSGALTRYNHELVGPLPMSLDEDVYLPNELGDGVCSDKGVIDAYVNDPLVEKQISVRLLNTLNDGIEWLKENAVQFVEPTLILHGLNDGLVSELDSRELFGEIGSKDKSLHIYSQLFHEILNEPCRDKIISEIIQWIDERI